MQIIEATTEHISLLENLLELYSYELSAVHPIGFTLDSNGRFGYKFTPLYFSEASHHAFIFFQNGEPCGFVLVNNDCRFPEGNFWMAEFFIVKKFQRSGLGTEAAHAIFRKFLGNWEIGVAYTSRSAQEFWRKCIRSYTKFSSEIETNTEQHHWRGIVFRFQNA